MRILVVDDDAVTREMLKYALAQDRHQILTACDGREALEMIKAHSCRLVISDWEMPRMDGLELCRAIRSMDLNAYLYFILLTRHGRSEDIVAGLSAGADDYITKPFEHAELRVRIRAGERILGLETRDVTIFAMAKLAESRDPETGAHLERVRNYSRILADQLGKMPKYQDAVDRSFVQLIYETSPLHDIGKVGIPDFVLRKPDMLSPSEVEIMRTHTRRGAQTVEAALEQYPHARFLIMARDIALTHHERFDGTGYPDGLAGEEIPLCGRLVALADVYDALTSPRVYKEAYTHEMARSIIVEESGRHFDPDIVTAFLGCEDEFVAVARRYADALVVDPSTIYKESA